MMFNSDKKTENSISSNFGDEFIHTMNDDLNPNSKPIKPPSDPLKDSPFAASPSTQEINKQTLNDLKKITPVLTDSPFSSQSSTQTNPETTKNIDQQSDLQKNKDIKIQSPIQTVEKAVTPKKGNGPWILLMIILSFLIILVSAAGGYYFWLTKYSQKESGAFPLESEQAENATTEEPAETNGSAENQIVVSPLSEKYSSEKPNYLSVSVEKMTAEEFKQKIVETSGEIAKIQSKNPFEFIITDSNNNPFAFPIFASFANIKIAPEILTDLNEKFTLYIYNDGEKQRLGMAVDLKNKSKIMADIQKEETKTLVESLSFFFLNDPYVSKKELFTTATYNGVGSRYLNLNAENTISIDYGIYDNQLIIATSKNTFRAILDKLLADKSSQELNATSVSPKITTPVDNL